MTLTQNTILFVACGLLAFAGAAPAAHHEVMVTIESLTPDYGVFFTPVWVGFHDGSFDLFDPGGLASEALERIAEDGDVSVARAAFADDYAEAGGLDDVITAPDGFAGAPVFDPGDRASAVFVLDAKANRYLSFASMVIPSNDAFIANHDPQAIEVYDETGNFAGKKIITILGSMVWDAGTELNTEMDAAFINQAEPNTGATTMCPVLPHPGFLGSVANRGSDPVILGGTGPGGMPFGPVAADFTRPNAVIARITIDLAPGMEEPETDTGGAQVSIQGRGNGPVGTVYVTGQGLYYDTFVTAETLPNRGRFQQLYPGDPSTTAYGPGQPGYLGGRWWVDVNNNGQRDDGDDFFLCPLLGPGRETP
jgi:hypothetical protein